MGKVGTVVDVKPLVFFLHGLCKNPYLGCFNETFLTHEMKEGVIVALFVPYWHLLKWRMNMLIMVNRSLACNRIICSQNKFCKHDFMFTAFYSCDATDFLGRPSQPCAVDLDMTSLLWQSLFRLEVQYSQLTVPYLPYRGHTVISVNCSQAHVFSFQFSLTL